MNILDTHFVRNQFPAFASPLTQEWAFMDNAGGSYVTTSVLQKMNHYMTNTRVQPYLAHPASAAAGAAIDESFHLFAELINAKPQEIIFNASTSMNNYILANAFRKLLRSGDEIIVTNQDHESNIGVWRRLAENNSGVIIKEWCVSPESGLLDINDLNKLLSGKTRLVCATHCSNVTGTINDIKAITLLAKKHGAKILIDGVAYAPHDAIDVKDLDVDFYVYSLYKTYGPHLGLLYAKEEHLIEMENQGHYLNQHNLRKKWTPGGPQYAEIAYASGVIDYYRAFYEHHIGKNTGVNLNQVSKAVHKIFHEYEISIGKPVLEYLNSKNNIRIIGLKEIQEHKRVPTISFVSASKTSKHIVAQLLSYKIAASQGHFYAKRLCEAVKMPDPDEGVVRISLLHYNTEAEVQRLIHSLDLIL